MKIFLRSLLLTITLIISNPILAQKLYWVGGSGNFNDPAHWSYTSNGLGGAKTPALTDDVYFDEYSFKSNSVINIISGATCHHLIFADNTAPIILSGTQNEKLTISGDVKFNPYIDNQFLGETHLTSSSANTSVLFSSSKIKGNLFFDGLTNWNLKTLLGSDNSIFYFNNGKVILNNSSIFTGSIIVKDNVVIDGTQTVLNAKNKLWLNDGAVLVNHGVYIEAPIEDATKFNLGNNQIPANRLAGNNSTLACAFTFTVQSAPLCAASCDGIVSFTIPASCAGPLTYTATWIAAAGCSAPAGTPATILSFGTYTQSNVCGCGSNYTVLFADNLGNFAGSASVPVTAPSVITAFLSPVKPLCNGVCNGKINAIIIGGTQPYTVQWNPGPVHINNFGSDSVTGLCAPLSYSVTITDNHNCTYTNSVNLTQPTSISVNGNVKAPLCAGVCNGLAMVAPSGGTPFAANQANGIKYTTVWDANPALNNDSLVGLCAASTHTCVVTDKNGCTASYIVTVPPAPLPITFTQTNNSPLNCRNVCNGILSVNSVAGGTSPYTYSWTPIVPTATTATSATASNLCSGNYTATIKDVNGCTAIATFTITAPTAITHTITTINPLCNGGFTGSIKDVISGGTPPYTSFGWSAPLGTITTTTSSSTDANLGFGTYSVVVTDNKGCKDTAIATLFNPPVLNAVLTFTNPSCFGGSNGQICVTPSGGTGADTYSWSPAPQPTTPCISGLGAGGYTVVVSDSNNCNKTVSTTLISPPIINVAVVKVNPKCFGVCNGSATVTASGGSGGGYTYNWSCAAGNTSTILTGQCGGTSCTVTVTDGNGCSVSKVISFINPNPLSVSISATSLVCANQCNAQITSNVIGGTPTYTYNWSGTGANPVCVSCPNQTNMCAGSYSLIVTDSNNCTASASVVVSAPNPLIVSLTPTNPSCAGSCDGSISSAISGGSLPYAFSWNPSTGLPLTPTPNNLCPGSYTLTVIDANGCLISQSTTLTSPIAVTAGIISMNITCAGSCNGTATVTAAGGTTPYLYSWDGAAYTASTSTLNLCAGTHTVQVKDSKGCAAAPVIYAITQPQALTANVSNITKSCLNICNGTASGSASGGTPGYTYSWDVAAGPFGNVTNTSTLCIGTHTLYVKDANGCIASTIFNVQVIINVNILANALSVSCNNVCDGSASATASGGVGPYTFSWTPPPNPVPNCTNVNSCTAFSLCPGTYTVLVTDQTGCASEDSITILNPPILTANTAVTPATCFGNCNGSATVTPSGGTAPYTEQWSNNGIIGPNPCCLCPGTYTATVVDNRGCKVVKPVVITSSPQFTVVPTVSSPTACVSSTGSISLAISGGSGSYTVTWSNPPGGTGMIKNNLAAGIYTATVTDGNGCDTTLTIGVSDPTGPTTSVVINNNATCFGSCNGSATVSGSGVNPINVNWSTAPGTPSGLSPVSDNALCAGNYPVKVTDGNGCITIAPVIITEPTKILDNVIITPLTCSSGNTGSISLSPSGGSGLPYTFTIDGTATSNPITGLSAGIHTVVITDGTPCSATYTYNINVPTTIVVTINKTNELCAGSCNGTAQAGIVGGTPPYTYLWSSTTGTVSINPNVAGLCAGTYTLFVNDVNNCSIQTTVVINAANLILPNLVQQNNNCNTGCTGAATVTPTGGAGGSFTYNWNAPGNPITTSVNSLCPGNYFVTITDTNRCSITKTFTITTPPTVTATVVFTRPSCFGYANGSATVTPSGGTPTYTVTWSAGGCIGCVTTNSLIAGSYVTTVTDSKGCSGSTTFTINDTTKLNANTLPTNPLCNNNCNGSIVSSPVGGNGNNTYQWLGVTPSPGNSPTAINLCPGTYTLIVTDSKNCKDTSHVTLTNPPAITLTESQSAATCGQNNGAVTISTVTPTGTLAVNWLSGSCGTNPICNNLSAGIYSVTLTDANNCKDTFQIGITNSNGPLTNTASTNVTCFGSCDGTASITNVTGNAAFSYSWTPSVTSFSTATSSVASGLCNTPPGPAYISTITDALSCKTLTTFSISSPPKITDNPNIINATCAGLNNGSITSNGSGGTPFAAGYLYSFNGGSFSAINTFINLAVGTYTVCIKDSLGCTNCFNYTISGSTIILSSLTSTNNNCFGVCNATATLSNVVGGAQPYLITWNDPNGQVGPIAINLCAGTYTATIKDTMGCKVTQVAIITAPTTSVSPNYTVSPPACGLCNGTINLAPSGGNGGAYTYTWSTANTTPNLTNVCAGVYQVDIDDAFGCKTTYQIPVSNSNAPTAAITSTNVTCGGFCNGSASITASGGTTPYTYNWVSPSAATPSISNLCPGTYFVQVKDAANCVQTQSVSITAPTLIVVNQTVTPTDCGKCNGAFNLLATGGSGPITYSVTGPSGALPSLPIQSNLCAGSYTLVVSDGSCSQTSFININSSNAPLVSISTTNPTCFGLNNGTASATIIGGVPVITTVWSNGATTNPATGLNSGTYNLVVTDNNGCASVKTFTITSPTQIGLSLSNTQLPSCTSVCNGLLTAIPSGGTLPYTYTWTPISSNQPSINNLCAGNYTVNVTDANGCAISQGSTLINNPFLINPNPTIVQPSCAQCNGSITLAPTGGSGPYTYTWSTGIANPLTNVCAGIYQVAITDGVGCQQNISIPVSSSSSPTLTVNSTNVTCNGLSNGSATATATGGILPYIFSWPSIPSNSATVTGLNATTYFVQVKDSAGCIATQSVTITQPTALNANATMVSPTSCTVCDGSISTAVTGGTGPYTYSWSPSGGSGPIANNLCAGIYALTITDQGTGCTNTLSISLNSIAGPTLTVASTNQKCFGVCNGSATVTAIGGAGGYTYTWTPSGGNAAIASGLCSTMSPFIVEVQDAAGCIQTQSVTLNEPSQLIASLPTITDPKCLNNTNGAIATVVSGGTPAYTYSWSPPALSGPNPQNLGAGVYTYTVTDANGCTISQTATLVDNLLVINANATITKPTCAQCDGQILLAPSGGTGTYTYTWPTSNANPLTNVCAGIYQVTITDAIGCQQIVQIPVSSSNSPTVTVNTINITCNGFSNGSATATATGGILPYIFSWPAIPSNSATVTGLNATTYFVQVKDSAGCIATQSVTITQPTALNANATMALPTSCTVCDGSISTAVTGGTGSYTYSWGSASMSNLCAGVYTLTITDNGTGCKDTLSLALNSPNGPTLSIASTDEKCFGVCNGSATVTATGGAGGYTYTWTPNGGNNAVANNLCINTYFAEVADAAGCIQTQSVTINQPNKLITSLPTITPVKCNNEGNGAINTVVSGGTPTYTYSWNPATAAGSNPQNLPAGLYTLTVTDANGCVNSNEVDTLTNPTPIILTGTTTPASCNNTPDGSITTTTSGGTPGYTWLWSSNAVTPNLPAILPGSYSVMVMDSHGCMKDTSFTVISTVTVTVNTGSDTSLCNNSSVVLTGTVIGATTYDWSTGGVNIPPANTLSISVNPTSTTQYILTATNLGCTNSDTVIVSISPVALANAGPDQSILSGQGINIGGNPTNPGGGSVVWVPYSNLTDTSATNPVASPTLTTTYIVTVTNSSGCIAKDTMVVIVLPPFDIPNGFTPNGDSKNDTWMLDNLFKFPNAEVEVYNRWGEQLFYSRGNYHPWDGTYNGTLVPVGTYYYIIKLNDKNYPDHYAGPLTILR